MKPSLFVLLALLFFLPGGDVLAHPGSGIVVDREGNVYFLDTGSGVWKIDTAGHLTNLHGPRYHWMAIDIDGRLANATLPGFSEDNATVTRVGSNPTLLVSSDFPVTVGPDGSLYYPWVNAERHVQIFRLTPSDSTTVVKTLPTVRSPTGEVRWRNGIAVTADGSIYYTEDRAVRKISPQGELTTVLSDPELSGCGQVAGVGPEVGVYFRGLDVDADGTVYVAATGCRSVLKITPDGKVATLLRASDPWSPTAVALYRGTVYVLEYVHTANESRREWVPRVRKISPDGQVATVATIDRR